MKTSKGQQCLLGTWQLCFWTTIILREYGQTESCTTKGDVTVDKKEYTLTLMKTKPEKWKELVADIVDRTEDIVIVKELAGPHQTCLPHHQHHPQLWFLLLRRQQLFLCFCVSSVITRQPLNRVWKCTQGWSKSSEIQISFKFGIMFTTFDQILCGAYSNLNFDIFISPGWTNNVFKVWGKIIFSVLSWWTLGWARW